MLTKNKNPFFLICQSVIFVIRVNNYGQEISFKTFKVQNCVLAVL